MNVVGLFGTMDPWRPVVIKQLKAKKIKYYDPTNALWKEAYNDKGIMRNLIKDDIRVFFENRGCFIVHIADFSEVFRSPRAPIGDVPHELEIETIEIDRMEQESQQKSPVIIHQAPKVYVQSNGLIAREEFTMLAGMGKRVYMHVESKVWNRNDLECRASCFPENVVWCDKLD